MERSRCGAIEKRSDCRVSRKDFTTGAPRARSGPSQVTRLQRSALPTPMRNLGTVRHFEPERRKGDGHVKQRGADSSHSVGLSDEAQVFSAIAMDDDDIRVLLAGFG